MSLEDGSSDGLCVSAFQQNGPHNMVTTQFELDGFRVTRTLGFVRGIVPILQPFT